MRTNYVKNVICIPAIAKRFDGMQQLQNILTE
jgi:hypothetical protein